MPKRTDLKTILIIGAGPIVIGQACEFDYSGAQACKALREEGYRVVLVNSNPATIMTDPDMADAVYIEPINWQTVERIIAKEKPDALLPTMGGQTALNCALDLADNGVLEKYGVELIGAKRDAIRMAEDRELFRVAMGEIGLECPKAEVARSLEQALDIQTRQLMENEVLGLWAEKRKAVLFITHDLDEAIAMSDRVICLSAGPGSHPIGEFAIDLPRPRDVSEVRVTPRFVELHQAIWSVLRDEVLTGYQQQLAA